MPATTIVDGHRPCSRCRVVKPLSQEHFHRNRAKGDGFSSTCKTCFATKVDAPRLARDRDKRLAYGRAAYRANPGKKLSQGRSWKLANRARSYEINARSLAKRLVSDPVFKFSRSLSNSIRRSMHGAKAGCGWEQLLGYTAAELREHLQRQFTPAMSWSNYGRFWHIDHVRPIAAFRLSPDHARETVIAEARECWALSNLRPLPAIENLRKGARVF